MTSAGFAVLDVETTGLNPEMHDRIIEIAVIQTDERGSVTGRWETLVNPERDLGAQHVHGILSRDVLDAPTFSMIASELIEQVTGRVLVAHNADFDCRFVMAEFERAGVEVWERPVAVCTMQLARHFLPGAGRSLADCCDACDIELVDAHRAVADASATASLLEAYIAMNREPEFWEKYLRAAGEYQWPRLTAGRAAALKSRPAGHETITAESFLSRITRKLPDFSGPAEHLDYLALLDRALVDRLISVHEADSLVSLAEQLGVSRDAVSLLHESYFDSLVQTAWSDGILEDHELADIRAVGALLDIRPDRVAGASAPRGSRSDEISRSEASSSFALAVGDLVVLTGEMTRPREQIEADLVERGIVPWQAITKKVKLLVAADPDSLSGKARKARDYGITIVSERGLSELLNRLGRR